MGKHQLSSLFAALALVTGAGRSSADSRASQFHLSFTSDGSGDYILDWATPSSKASAEIFYGVAPNALTRVAKGVANGVVEEAPGTFVNTWTARLTGLKRDAVVYYAPENVTSPTSPVEQQRPLCDDDSVEPTQAPPSVPIRQFRARSLRDEDLTWAIYGDMGSPGASNVSGLALPALKRAAVEDKAFDAMFNLGDLAYELTLANGKIYMDELEPVTSRVPMQITTGNHEYRYALAPHFTLRNYNRRFAGQLDGVGKPSGSNSKEYYSFDSGHVHFVVLNTEFYSKDQYVKELPTGEWIQANETRGADAKVQLEWFKNDLSRVDRRATPFIVVLGHRCHYESPKRLDDSKNKFGRDLVPVMHDYDVDLYVCGHTHHYMVLKESTWNNYRIPPIIVTGTAGKYSGLDSFNDIELGHFEPLYREERFGYGYLKATAQSLEWRWGNTATPDAKATPWTYSHSQSFPRRV
ncbi:hypothetical protein P43SY_008362 [Pythium insidiosum]|uniref:Purple acid phosphatase n=1 Tax=Pythium insidiosum TaxID=114742 RepID=A0AAD5QBD2_PYTIN|nr:hypothetical protein P43SY_008362 [Pythium insidiosum]